MSVCQCKDRITLLIMLNFVQLTDDTNSERDETNPGGYSVPLCSKIVESLRTRPEKFHLKTLCVLEHNTNRVSERNACPVVTGFVVSFFFMIVFFLCYCVFYVCSYLCRIARRLYEEIFVNHNKFHAYRVGLNCSSFELTDS